MANTNSLVDCDRFIRFGEVRQICGFSRSTAWRLYKKNKFPKPIRIGDRACAWVLSEILGWVESRKNAASSTVKELQNVTAFQSGNKKYA